jgi:peroxiredoxin Q/BCP
MSVNIGDKAPDFILPDQEGNTFSLNDFIGKRNILLYFYPKDETPGCIAEACGFRDNIVDFEGYNCKVVGISKDSVNSHAKFTQHYNLPFTLLSDKKNVARILYGVESKILGLLPGRKTYLINKQGTITHIFDYQFKAKRHVIDTLKALSNE